MFERYTEKARRTVFFARYHSVVAPAHLLLGLRREESSWGAEILRGHGGDLSYMREAVSRQYPVRLRSHVRVDPPEGRNYV